MYKIVGYFSLVSLLAVIFIGCDLDAQTTEANKLTDEVNVINDKYNKLVVETNDLHDKLLGENLTKVSNLKKYKEDNSEDFEKLIKLRDNLVKVGKERTDKYSQILKLDVSEKFKEYVKANLETYKKTDEANQLTSDFVNSFMKTDDIDEVDKIIEENNKASEKIGKEIDDLEKKAKQIEKDNPDEIQLG